MRSPTQVSATSLSGRAAHRDGRAKHSGPSQPASKRRLAATEAIPGCPGTLLPEWAALAERRGFSSVATIDRIVFPSHESMTSLAVAAAVTNRIGLLTNIVLLPTRNPVVITKEAATIAAISLGRLTIGVGVGGRQDDFEATKTEWRNRGRRTDAMLDSMIRAWRGEPVAGHGEPVVSEVPGDTIPLLIGGYGEAGVRRAVRYGVGFTAGGIPPDQVAALATRVRDEWRNAGRDGEPRIVALTYFSVGDDVEERSYSYLRRYYAYTGNGDAIASSALRTPKAIQDALERYTDVGVDELILDPTVAELSQVERLADTVL
jgi:alkanesulfonate monooxygenase SsuD/methylene tetrahydromethanopterin reductase-like flavin-dependent oxidoreductase (luciferase family)